MLPSLHIFAESLVTGKLVAECKSMPAEYQLAIAKNGKKTLKRAGVLQQSGRFLGVENH